MEANPAQRGHNGTYPPVLHLHTSIVAIYIYMCFGGQSVSRYAREVDEEDAELQCHAALSLYIVHSWPQ